MYENKEEALRELNKIIDEYGIGFNELKENYSSEKTVNTKKKDKVRIRLLSENEAILKLMVPYGNKQNGPTYFSYPLLISDNKYAIGHEVFRYTKYSGDKQYSNAYLDYNYDKWNEPLDTNSENKIINILNNYYAYAAGNTGHCGFLAQSNNWYNRRYTYQGYGTLFQDNYEDKPEIRCDNIAQYLYVFGSVYTERFYNKNGNACTSYIWNSVGGGGQHKFSQTVVTTYKTSAMQYQGMLPLFAV